MLGLKLIHVSKRGHRKSAHSLPFRHTERDGVSNYQPHDCLLNRLFRRRSKKTSKLRVTGLCVGNSPVTGEFLRQRVSNAKNVFISWRHLITTHYGLCTNAKYLKYIKTFIYMYCIRRRLSNLIVCDIRYNSPRWDNWTCDFFYRIN